MLPSVAGASSVVNYGAAKNAPSSSVSGELFIPKIGVSAPIIKSSSTDAGIILNDLKSGVVLYPDSSLPGLGSSVIIGHSSSNLPWRKYGTVFAKLNNLSEGDSIYVEYEGRNLVYTVTGKKMGDTLVRVVRNLPKVDVMEAKDLNALDVIARKNLLILQEAVEATGNATSKK